MQVKIILLCLLLQQMYSDLGKEPPQALLRRLESIDARRQQVTILPNACTVHVFYLEDISSRELILFGARMPI